MQDMTRLDIRVRTYSQWYLESGLSYIFSRYWCVLPYKSDLNCSLKLHPQVAKGERWFAYHTNKRCMRNVQKNRMLHVNHESGTPKIRISVLKDYLHACDAYLPRDISLSLSRFQNVNVVYHSQCKYIDRRWVNVWEPPILLSLLEDITCTQYLKFLNTPLVKWDQSKYKYVTMLKLLSSSSCFVFNGYFDVLEKGKIFYLKHISNIVCECIIHVVHTCIFRLVGINGKFTLRNACNYIP